MRIILALLLIVISGCSQRGSTVEVVSLNIRYDNPADGINAWPERRDMLAAYLIRESPDLFGIQESLWHQYAYLDSIVADYGSVAAGRDDGKKAGEMTPLFFRKDMFELSGSGTFWLSETPDLPGSKGWGAVLPRIVTWASLILKESGEQLYFFNTHFSHMSDSARVMSSKVLRSEVERIAGDHLFIITGDFNMLPGSKAYNELVISPIVDSFAESIDPPEGLAYTFNGFSEETGSGRIDYIFVKKGLRVLSHSTRKLIQDSVFISDHWPVKAALLF